MTYYTVTKFRILRVIESDADPAPYPDDLAQAYRVGRLNLTAAHEPRQLPQVSAVSNGKRFDRRSAARAALGPRKSRW